MSVIFGVKSSVYFAFVWEQGSESENVILLEPLQRRGRILWKMFLLVLWYIGKERDERACSPKNGFSGGYI